MDVGYVVDPTTHPIAPKARQKEKGRPDLPMVYLKMKVHGTRGVKVQKREHQKCDHYQDYRQSQDPKPQNLHPTSCHPIVSRRWKPVRKAESRPRRRSTAAHCWRWPDDAEKDSAVCVSATPTTDYHHPTCRSKSRRAIWLVWQL